MSVPVSLDFLEDIVAVQWPGGKSQKFAWFAIQMRLMIQSDPSTNMKVVLSFPSIIGGSPGVELINGRTTNSAFHGAPFTIGSGDLVTPFSFPGGLVGIGFAVGNVQLDSFGPPDPTETTNAIVYLRLDNSFKGSILARITQEIISGGGPGSPTQYAAFTFPKSTVDLFPGFSVRKTYDLPQPIADGGVTTIPSSNPGAVLDFRINAKTLKVTAPPDPP
jgi:hypothetical protein